MSKYLRILVLGVKYVREKDSNWTSSLTCHGWTQFPGTNALSAGNISYYIIQHNNFMFSYAQSTLRQEFGSKHVPSSSLSHALCDQSFHLSTKTLLCKPWCSVKNSNRFYSRALQEDRRIIIISYGIVPSVKKSCGCLRNIFNTLQWFDKIARKQIPP